MNLNIIKGKVLFYKQISRYLVVLIDFVNTLPLKEKILELSANSYDFCSNYVQNHTVQHYRMVNLSTELIMKI